VLHSEEQHKGVRESSASEDQFFQPKVGNVVNKTQQIIEFTRTSPLNLLIVGEKLSEFFTKFEISKYNLIRVRGFESLSASAERQ